MEETQIKMPALFGIRLKKKDLPKESDVIKSKKSEDVLYKRWRDFYEKHN
ncbi:hypothetical protein JCM19301_1769 [Jejuia pallidilutea]|nr:hypothetical protein JCM19301_1769 [Jejuia pallidilutea]